MWKPRRFAYAFPTCPKLVSQRVDDASVSAWEIIAFVLAGLAAGAYGTLVGVGGGLLIVPLLLFVGFSPKDAAGTSMVVVFANALSGSISFLRRGVVAPGIGTAFALVGLPGVVLGAFLDQLIPRLALALVFGIFLVLMAARLFWNPFAGIRDEPQADSVTPARRGFALVLAVIAGFLASSFGIGGGVVYVPTLTYVLRYPVHVATATSTFAIALTALFGSVSHAYYHDVHWSAAAALAVGAVGGAQLGAALAPRVRSKPLLRLFAVAVLLSGVLLIARAVLRQL